MEYYIENSKNDLIRYKIFEDDYFDADIGEDILKSIQSGESTVYCVIKQVLQPSRVDWNCVESIGGIIEYSSRPISDILFEVIREYFGNEI